MGKSQKNMGWQMPKNNNGNRCNLQATRQSTGKHLPSHGGSSTTVRKEASRGTSMVQIPWPKVAPPPLPGRLTPPSEVRSPRYYNRTWKWAFWAIGVVEQYYNGVMTEAFEYIVHKRARLALVHGPSSTAVHAFIDASAEHDHPREAAG